MSIEIYTNPIGHLKLYIVHYVMGFYSKHILPHIINSACKQTPAMKQREKVVPQAEGRVLEIGIGSGLNLSFYDPEKVKEVVAIDPSPETWAKNQVEISKLGFNFEFIESYAHDIPVDNNSIDTVVITYTMCTIPDLNTSFEEIRRVMKPQANLIFTEHGKAPDLAIEKWQNMINPIWKKFGGGCHLNRDIPKLILDNGFKITDLNTMYVPGWKPASFNYWGKAKVG